MKVNSPHSTLNYLIDKITEFEDEGCLISIGCFVMVYPDVYSHAVIYPTDMNINPRLEGSDLTRYQMGDCLYEIYIMYFDEEKHTIHEIMFRILSKLLDKFAITSCYDPILTYDCGKKIFLRKL